MKFNPANLDELLDGFVRRNPDVEAIALMSEEGLPIAKILPKEINNAHISALAAVIQFIGEKVAGEMNNGELQDIIIKSTDGYLFVSNVHQNFVLIVTTKDTDIRLGLLSIEIQRFIHRLGSFSVDDLNELKEKIFSLMEEKNRKRILIERKNLPELFKTDLLNYKTYDGLPSFNPAVIIQLKIMEIEVKLKGDSIKISSSKKV